MQILLSSRRILGSILLSSAFHNVHESTNYANFMLEVPEGTLEYTKENQNSKSAWYFLSYLWAARSRKLFSKRCSLSSAVCSLKADLWTSIFVIAYDYFLRSILGYCHRFLSWYFLHINVKNQFYVNNINKS